MLGHRLDDQVDVGERLEVGAEVDAAQQLRLLVLGELAAARRRVPVECSMWPRPRSSAASSTSTPTTARPLRAKTSAMPAPIVPSPTTPTCWNSRVMIHVLLAPSMRSVAELVLPRDAKDPD